MVSFKAELRGFVYRLIPHYCGLVNVKVLSMFDVLIYALQPNSTPPQNTVPSEIISFDANDDGEMIKK